MVDCRGGVLDTGHDGYGVEERDALIIGDGWLTMDKAKSGDRLHHAAKGTKIFWKKGEEDLIMKKGKGKDSGRMHGVLLRRLTSERSVLSGKDGIEGNSELLTVP